MNVFRVWVEIEEQDEDGDTVDAHWSTMLDGASVGSFDDPESAIVFGNLLQHTANHAEAMEDAVRGYDAWLVDNPHPADREPGTGIPTALWDEQNTDWVTAIADEAMAAVRRQGGE